MQFSLNKDVYQAARITGPEHNFLGIQLANKHEKIDVVQLPLKTGECALIGKGAVVAQVEQGLLDVNISLRENYAISKIFFVPSDTPSTSVYRYLTVELIKRIHRRDVFLNV